MHSSLLRWWRLSALSFLEEIYWLLPAEWLLSKRWLPRASFKECAEQMDEERN
jgi:hypothetical protein